jgi:hypothetical protein
MLSTRMWRMLSTQSAAIEYTIKGKACIQGKRPVS